MTLNLRIIAWSALVYGIAQAQTATLTSRAGAADGLSATPLSAATSASSSQPASNTILINGTSTAFRVLSTLPASVDETQPLLPNIYDAQAVNAQTACPGYKATDIKKNDYGFTANLNMAGPGCNVYGNDVAELSLAVQYQSDKRLSVKISPRYLGSANLTRYEIPAAYVGQPSLDKDAENTVPATDLQFTYTNVPTFGFAVLRKSTGDVLFDTRGKKLIFEDQFVEFATSMPKDYNMYGLGEHIHGWRLGNNFTATIYAADAGDPIDGNIYGSHPIYVDTRYYEVDQRTGNTTLVSASAANATADYVSYSHAVFLRNAHGQEVLMRPSNVTWRTLGGNVDLYFYDGPSVTDIIQDYQTSTVGLPALQSYWTFGYHQCRWGYANWTELESVVDTFRKFSIPLETVWTDIDYMNQYRDFDNDAIRFAYPQGKEFLAKLRAQGQHYVPIVDSAIYIPNPMNASDAYGTYTRGNDSDVFITNADGSQYIGAVWPGYTVFPDWRAPNASSWWTSEMLRWHDLVDFSGIWIDMSEASSFCVGSCGTGHVTENPVHPPFALPGEVGNMIFDYPEGFNVTNSTEAAVASSKSSSQAAAMSTAAPVSTSTTYLRTKPTPGARNEAFPPYVINNINGALPVHAISPNATHADGSSEYDIHNLWGYEILNATYRALAEVFPSKRPFIIGRSTFAGAGKVAGHWGGDNYSQWRYMFFSIPQALSFSLFGIPMFGVDTCGFNGASDEELCNRWMQLSAMFPFYRNHNTLSAPAQEPYVWASVAEATRKAMHIRYSLLPYMYTLFHQAHTTGSTVMRALAWEFPNDPSLASADRQFLLGPSLMVTPVLEPGATSVNGVFPGAGKGTVWYDWYSQMVVCAKAGQNMTIAAPLSHIPLFVRGGSILPMQAPGYTTEASRKNPWTLLAALDSEGSATGSIYLDDGESVSPNATKSVSLTIANNALYASSIGTYADGNALSNITVMGVPKKPSSITLNGKALPVSDIKYNATSKVLAVTGLGNATAGGVWAIDWSLAWSYEGGCATSANATSGQ